MRGDHTPCSYGRLRYYASQSGGVALSQVLQCLAAMFVARRPCTSAQTVPMVRAFKARAAFGSGASWATMPACTACRTQPSNVASSVVLGSASPPVAPLPDAAEGVSARQDTYDHLSWHEHLV
ncbi:hypothetical protein CVIRNUC_005126 [Coccomyxa viridis]|uniref:Uncharacterized protein n=1 Tax=Coccomyxa viridis TaxID=1274662 RepID=A0AAV1I7Z1_9CHLO|nr:hypothetical protein CVIRNUC_005126 [Coccomyxa viridis]